MTPYQTIQGCSRCHVQPAVAGGLCKNCTEMEAVYIREQNEKYEQVFLATGKFLAIQGISISWDGDAYRITQNHKVLDVLYPDRESAYVAALYLVIKRSGYFEQLGEEE